MAATGPVAAHGTGHAATLAFHQSDATWQRRASLGIVLVCLIL